MTSDQTIPTTGPSDNLSPVVPVRGAPKHVANDGSQETVVSQATSETRSDSPASSADTRATTIGGTNRQCDHATAQVKQLSRLGVYEIQEQIGEGACGVLYRAIDRRLDRSVAIKVLNEQYARSSSARHRIAQEARAAASINHPCIVSVYDVDTESTQAPFIAMEFVDGETIKQHIDSEGPADPQQAVQWVSQIASALQAAHNVDLVHRDVKPSNILLDHSNHRALITDFGIACEVSDDLELTPDNVIAGTPAYMSPEQIESPEQVTSATDVYSLGVTLYELLSGDLPFEGASVRAVLAKILHEIPPPLCRASSKIDATLEAICFKAMAKDVTDRYRSADAFRQDLERWLNQEPVEAVAVNKPSRPLTWQTGIGIAAALTILVVVCFLCWPVATAPDPEMGGSNSNSAPSIVANDQLPSRDAALPIADASGGETQLEAFHFETQKHFAKMMKFFERENEKKFYPAAEATLASSLAGLTWIENQQKQSRSAEQLETQQEFELDLYRMGGEALSQLTEVSLIYEDYAVASRYVKQRKQLANQLKQRFPDTNIAQQELTESYYDSGFIFLMLDDVDSAKSEFAESIKLFELRSPKTEEEFSILIETLVLYAEALDCVGEVERSIEIAERAAEVIDQQYPNRKSLPRFEREWLDVQFEILDPILGTAK
ncbi:MAG: serine/threonine-protein kinase [Planctomycetota bacterium]